jgi:hypothetical protein
MNHSRSTSSIRSALLERSNIMSADLVSRLINRRALLSTGLGGGLGLAALASLWNTPKSTAGESLGSGSHPFDAVNHCQSSDCSGSFGKAKRVIYLHQAGAPSQIDLFDYKPSLSKWHGKNLPDSVRQGQRLTELTANQAELSLAASKFRFARYGHSGAWLSELLPHHRQIVDKVCFVQSMYTEAINHVQAASFTHTGSEQPGRPSLGAWLSYGLGSINSDLPAYVVLTSKGSAYRGGESLQQQLWSSGFLPPEHQGVQFRSQRDAVLYLSSPQHLPAQLRRRQFDALSRVNRLAMDESGDEQTLARIEQFEMAFRMQASVPALTNLADEPESTYQLYGQQARQPGTYAYNCLLARRMAERNVRFIQLFHRGWDQHSSLNYELPKQAADVDQASAALVLDLEQRGLLDDTLVVWGSEFGRTSFSQGALDDPNYGRDHHPRCYTLWLAGGGVRAGIVHGKTDELGYNVEENPVHVHDLNATLLHCLGIDHRRLTFPHQGRDFRLTDVAGTVVNDLLV